MNEKYESLKNRWNLGWITKDTLRGWVVVNGKNPGAGITPKEYKQITNESYI